jgi:hypothetical protein
VASVALCSARRVEAKRDHQFQVSTVLISLTLKCLTTYSQGFGNILNTHVLFTLNLEADSLSCASAKEYVMGRRVHFILAKLISQVDKKYLEFISYILKLMELLGGETLRPKSLTSAEHAANCENSGQYGDNERGIEPKTSCHGFRRAKLRFQIENFLC